MNSIEAQKYLTDRELIIFNAELERKRKSTATAYILYFILGSIGGHKFYIGKPFIGFLYLLLLSLSTLLILGGAASTIDSSTADDASLILGLGLFPFGLLGLMLFIDLFTIPGQIKKQEERVRSKLLTQLVSSKA
ncbi:MAG: hypothetical protein CLLPBCKN_004292 [Chroococcidiopsis cubana SAG 39.79]|uniref:NINE protein n=1 Tax=Chroococcidiopsis cubana TaxID=171392 RepID=UPI000D04D0D6|nr:TM2 domain-containing protein [Chroococcidiopsis cubana]MDZ4874896.1 hypothetical protein [Chroococcidiopsis cubana SAG 39.79]PSB56689.1 hypothetical protein C7B79_31885 [Chroococcidiopsis cubana CCALA 043]